MTRNLAKYCRNNFQKSSLFDITLSVFYILLYRYTDREEILVNIPTTNRQEEKLGIVRVNLKGNMTFKEVLLQVTQRVEAESDLKQLHLKNDFGHGLLASVMFNRIKVGWHETDLEEKVSQIEPYVLTEQRETPYDLCVEIIELGDRLNVRWTYHPDCFNAETIDRMARHYLTVLEGSVANPEMPILELPLLTESERHQLLIEWNNTQVDYPKNKCIHQLFEEQVEKTPDTVALVFEGQELTYLELNIWANQLARYLQKLGVKPESLVGICVERSLEMVVGILGILKAGGAYVPLNPAAIEQRLTFVCEDSQVSVLLTQQSFLDRLPQIETPIVCLDADWESNSMDGENQPQNSVTAENLAYVIYTSGSTGEPKGVLISHSNLCPLLHWGYQHFPLTEGDRCLQYPSYYFDWSVWEIFITLTCGACLFIPSQEDALNFTKTLDFIKQNQITVLNSTPTQFQNLMGDRQSLESLKYISLGGEAVGYELVKRSHPLLPPDCRIFNMYGPTEATIITTVQEIDRLKIDLGQHLPTVPIGVPVANAGCYILNANHKVQPIGVTGELYIAGDGLARGYLNRPELTEQKFIPNPFSKQPGSRLYKTGDLARYLPDGNIEYIGRIDNQVKIRGIRIELGEIEAALAQHPDIQKVVVIAREDTPGDKRLVAYLITNREKPAIADWRAFLQTKLPDPMIPSAFVLLETIPLTPNGKVDRCALPAPDISSLVNASSFVAPRDSVEQEIAEIWSEVLGISPIGVRDDFLDLGGHSLSAAQIIGLVRSRLQVKLPLNRLFEAPTVAELATIVTQVSQEERSHQQRPL